MSCDLAELFDHGRGHLVHGHHAGEFVGIGEKISFERVRAGSDVGDQGGVGLRDFQEVAGGTEARGLDGAGDIEHGEALGDDHGVEVDIAAAEALLNVEHVRGLVEQVFPSLQGATGVHVVPEHEGFFAANDAGGLEFGGDAAGGIAGMEHDKHLPGRLGGRQNSPANHPAVPTAAIRKSQIILRKIPKYCIYNTFLPPTETQFRRRGMQVYLTIVRRTLVSGLSSLEISARMRLVRWGDREVIRPRRRKCT